MTQPEVTEYRIIHAVTDATGQRNVRLWISGVSRATGSAITAATSFGFKLGFKLPLSSYSTMF
jgi:hypothetical protein